MQIIHPESGLPVKAVALLQVLNGLNVRLVDDIPIQIETLIQALQTISENVDSLLTLPDQITELEALVGPSNSNPPPNDADPATVNARLIRLAQRLTTINTSITPIASKLDQMLTALQGGNVAPDTPTLINLSVPSRENAPPNNQASFLFPTGTRQFSIACRGGISDVIDTVYYSWLPDKTATQDGNSSGGFGTIFPGQVLVESEFALTSSKALYLSAETDLVVAISYWRAN